MFSTLHRFSSKLFKRDNERTRDWTSSRRGYEADAIQPPNDESDASSNWQTLSKNEADPCDKRDGPVVIRRSQRLLSGALSQLTFKNRLEFEVEADISRGHEKNRIAAFSYKRNDKAPSDFHYVSEYVQYDNIHLDSTLKIMSSCGCQGDCGDGRCACSSDHRTGRSYDSKGCLNRSYNVEAPHVIYECNAGCSCNRKTCKNTVIQRGSQGKFILFRTRSRGWGVRTLEPLRRGFFVGVYSGELISVGESRQREDDTYLFNLSNSQIIYTRSNDEKNEKSRDNVNGAGSSCNEPPPNEGEKQEQEAKESDDSFVCDAKFYGNFTRFINHSCEPNVIGIRSFTKHHDSRFPYIAFFTNKEIPANTELTLNYGDNYWLVKCKRDKVYCLCGRPCCRFDRRTFPRKTGASG